MWAVDNVVKNYTHIQWNPDITVKLHYIEELLCQNRPHNDMAVNGVNDFETKNY